jgi:RNA-directed DNA polymerase
MNFSLLVSWDNLWWAFRKATKGKRGKSYVASFEIQVAEELLQLQHELINFQYHPGEYQHFKIFEPKERKISAAPFRDRVIHHALCNLIEPVFDQRFIVDSYANRLHKGTHSALDRLQEFSRQYRYCLRADIVKHFPSLDHTILRNELVKVIQDPHIMWLIDKILASGEGVLIDEYPMQYFPGDDLFAVHRSRGLPIGNLTSQFWSNVYMNPFDWFVKRELHCEAYLRYVDDFVLFSDDKAQLWQWRDAIIKRLQRLRLVIHEKQAQVTRCQDGIPWLGFVVYPTHRRLKKRNAVNFTRRFRHNIGLYEQGKISFAELDASVLGWINFVRYGDTWGLRKHIFDHHPIRLRGMKKREKPNPIPQRKGLGLWKKQKKWW